MGEHAYSGGCMDLEGDGMWERPYELTTTPEGPVLRMRARGKAVLAIPLLNRGTAYTADERQALGLVGLLPHAVTTIDRQARRVYAQYLRQADDLAKNIYLAHLRERNEILFYRLLLDHLDEMLPIVYTPTIGQAIERYSHEYRRPHGVFLSIDHPQLVEESLRNYGLGPDEVDLIVATDSEGILGIGDWGVGGIDIAIGKLTLYTAAAGIDPRRVIPVVLDVGTDNLGLLNDEAYLGNRHARVRGQRYDDFVDAFVSAVVKLFPNALLHWEDLGAGNARRILGKYADQLCTFNDDMQGTAAVVLAAALSAAKATRTRMRDQRIIIYGAGTAGMGIADMLRGFMVSEGLRPDEATCRFWCLDVKGLITDDRSASLWDFQVPYARPAAEVAGWERTGHGGGISLADVIAAVHPTMLIGTSTHGGAFTRAIVQEMAAHVDRPVIMPLSNPTSKAEAAPEDLIRWTDGRVVIATGSPFDPVTHEGTTYRIAQANNALIFPGLGLGVIVARARRTSDRMLAVAADALAGLCDASTLGAPLLPPVDNLRVVSAIIAVAVAKAAVAASLAQVELHDPIQQVYEAMWQPQYPRVEPV
jgi:malate dehydrogenase (oxaloacetate-decarboxylating)